MMKLPAIIWGSVLGSRYFVESLTLSTEFSDACERITRTQNLEDRFLDFAANWRRMSAADPETLSSNTFVFRGQTMLLQSIAHFQNSRDCRLTLRESTEEPANQMREVLVYDFTSGRAQHPSENYLNLWLQGQFNNWVEFMRRVIEGKVKP